MKAYTLKLTKPITAHGQEVSELTLREPTTKDVTELGLPTLMVMSDEGGAAAEVRMKVVARYVSRLGAIPLGSVEQLALQDFQGLMAGVMGFFGQSDGSDESAASTSAQPSAAKS